MSLYHIEEELLRIFAEIEENEGEISEETWAQLNITKENLNQKLDNYVKAIKSWNGDVTTVKDEVKKLQANAKVKENRVERLKKAILQAVLLFGNDGKSGNKTIELPTVTIYTKGSQAIETNDSRINLLISKFEEYVRELVTNGILSTGQDVDLQIILDNINTICKAEYEIPQIEDAGTILEHFEPFTLADLTTLKIEITTTQSIYDLFRTGKDALIMYGNNPINTDMRNHTAKEDWKTVIQVADNINKEITESTNKEIVDNFYSYPTVAKIIKNTSIQMK